MLFLAHRQQPQDEASLSEYLKRLCSDVTLQSNKDGFFATYVTNIHSKLPKGYLDSFARLKTDTERIAFLWKLKVTNYDGFRL